MAFTWDSKDPDEVLDYNHNWSARLGDTDTISGPPQVIVDEGTVVVESTSFSNGIQTVWLSGGAEGENVKLTLRIETTGGRTYDEGIKLKVKDR